ncbi:hypothetical protein [Methanosarcina sp.]|nr:hypothetical protein [Methanosarcina sp.]HOW15788.1 hypothetical protein [Methanosarcina sp.]
MPDQENSFKPHSEVIISAFEVICKPITKKSYLSPYDPAWLSFNGL